MKIKLGFIYFFIATIIFSCGTAKNQSNKNNKQNSESNTEYFRFMFYNVENLFDINDDPEKSDEEFLPDQGKFWTYNRYLTKLNQIYQVIVAVGEWDLPDAIGLSEIENRFVLEQLLAKTPLYKSDYKIIHYESPDSRGIDVAFLYRESKFTPIINYPIPINFPEANAGKTRDILYIKGITNDKDTIHFFINHWPSRWGGQMETEEKRMFCAKIVKQKTDSIIKSNPLSNIIIAGDLNDYPTDKSVVEVLKAEHQFKEISNKKLYNLAYYLQEIKHLGTHKYHGEWGVLDQIIISGALLDKSFGLYTSLDDVHIFDAYFLLEDDTRNTGKQPFRTYSGYKYLGGYSDHLPVFLNLYRQKK